MFQHLVDRHFLAFRNFQFKDSIHEETYLFGATVNNVFRFHKSLLITRNAIDFYVLMLYGTPI